MKEKTFKNASLGNMLDRRRSVIFKGRHGSHDWRANIGQTEMEYFKTKANYENRPRDLLRCYRNTWQHFQEAPPEVRQIIGETTEDFYCYWQQIFPSLLIELFKCNAAVNLGIDANIA